jgi:hypothetical protein
MASGYDYSLDREAVAELLKCTARERRVLVDAFEAITRHPTMAGDYSFRGTNGRDNQVVEVMGFMVTFWPDHSARLVRILALERA